MRWRPPWPWLAACWIVLLQGCAEDQSVAWCNNGGLDKVCKYAYIAGALPRAKSIKDLEDADLDPVDDTFHADAARMDGKCQDAKPKDGSAEPGPGRAPPDLNDICAKCKPYQIVEPGNGKLDRFAQLLTCVVSGFSATAGEALSGDKWIQSGGELHPGQESTMATDRTLQLQTEREVISALKRAQSKKVGTREAPIQAMVTGLTREYRQFGILQFTIVDVVNEVMDQQDDDLRETTVRKVLQEVRDVLETKKPVCMYVDDPTFRDDCYKRTAATCESGDNKCRCMMADCVSVLEVESKRDSLLEDGDGDDELDDADEDENDEQRLERSRPGRFATEVSADGRAHRPVVPATNKASHPRRSLADLRARSEDDFWDIGAVRPT